MDLDLTHLIPSEIILKIFECNIITALDIIRFGATSKKSYRIIKSQNLWQCKFKQKWKRLWNIIQKYSDNDWLDVYKLRFKYIYSTKKAIEDLSWNQYYKRDISSNAFVDFQKLIDEDIYGTNFLLDEIREILFILNTESYRYYDLTFKFYTEITLVFVSQSQIRTHFDLFLNKPSEKQDLEEGAILFTHWHQPFIEIDAITNITKVLDDIADDVWSRFLNTHTSIVSNHFRAKSSTRTDYLTFVKFDPAKRLNREYTLELLKYVSTYLYCEYGFRGDYDHENWIQNSFINQVLERKMGIPITLSIVHKLIARRLDIECDIIDFPRRVILRYSFENEATNEDVNRKKDTFFIDPFDDGKFLTYSELQMASFVDHILEETDFKVASTKNIIQRLARNLIANLFSHPEEKEIFRCFRFSVECSLITNPSDFEMRFLLLKLYLYLGIELDKVLENLKELSNKGLHESLCKSLMTETNDKLIADNNRELHIVKRSDPINVDVLYSIGMIMTHKKYKYICVIISWDPFCRASEEWKRQMGVNKLQENGEYQPFYHVLVKDGTTRYAAQENLTFAPAPCFITHPDIGMYFEEYKGSHYTANLRKKMEYPEDEDFTGRITNAKYSPLDMQTRVYALKP